LEEYAVDDVCLLSVNWGLEDDMPTLEDDVWFAEEEIFDDEVPKGLTRALEKDVFDDAVWIGLAVGPRVT